MGVPKKKRWADDGRRGEIRPSKKKKKMGVPKKKDGETPIFFRLIFGAHLSPIPINNRHQKMVILSTIFNFNSPL